ncbi:tryptophan-rich sensory protein [Sinorhizobium medicae]|uniref:TspO/MBR family protein n=1 Tax=Sinorhizobium medicae TaxID=110321 RepID=UPI00037AF4E7|nr:TspO/MBR family protein [Sinorhizobium medicae]MDX1125194.1 tryptophan-rich sensory protein [Sinorhizobium medicae]PLU44801.1 tryptophan-rich sensory protein [Sinorhizobium medicae]UFX04123.1 tryptophan-rich sensory protein [Sinorhizobium medicae WSM1115]
MNRTLVHILFVTAVLGLGLAIGYINIPDAWYRSLAKPDFTPPDWIFAPAWSLLYIMIGIAGARSFLGRRRAAGLSGDRRAAQWPLWLAQMVLNFLWSPLFFGLHQIAAALVVICLLLASIAAFIIASLRQDGISALLFVPYLAWVAFATLLNGSIFLMN